MCYILFCSQVGLAVGDTKVIRDQIEFQRLSLKVCKSIHVLLCLCLYIMQYINFRNIYIRVQFGLSTQLLRFSVYVYISACVCACVYI